MNPFLIGVSRSTDHLCRRRIPRVVSETKNLLKIGGDHLDANPIRLGELTLGLRNRFHWRG